MLIETLPSKEKGRIKEIISPYVSVHGVIGRLHGYFEYHMAELTPIVTREQAVGRVWKAEQTIVNTLQLPSGALTKNYELSRETVRELIPISGLAVVGLIHEQEVLLLKLLISNVSANFFAQSFANEIKEEKEFLDEFYTREKALRDKESKPFKKAENKMYKLGCRFLLEEIVKKFSIGPENEFLINIKECLSYCNAVKHANLILLKELEEDMVTKRRESPIAEAGHIRQIVLWGNLFAFYVKALENFWEHIFNNLYKPSDEEKIIYCDMKYGNVIRKAEFDVNEYIHNLKNEFTSKKNEFWQKMEEQYDIKTDTVKLD